MDLLYIPRASLSTYDINSLWNLARSKDNERVDTHGGRKAALKYLLGLHAFGDDRIPPIDSVEWTHIQNEFDRSKKIDLFKRKFLSDEDESIDPYWELNNDSTHIHPRAKNARRFCKNSDGFSLEQLKIYFNRTQLDNIPYATGTLTSAGFVDGEARKMMIHYPVYQRHNSGHIKTKKARIEQAIFDVPHEKQIIVLDFADERMPGGFFLCGATTQEETICYNSDAYRALLDFKYRRFDGGFLIPEFGCLYVKDVMFFQPPSHTHHRTIDLVAAAAYDLTHEQGLYEVPESNGLIEANTRRKLETVVAAAQANSNGNGSDTYLLLGPIGCGAFQNPVETIARLWADVLLETLDEEKGTQQRHAFEQIWFLSGKGEKLKLFEQAFNLNEKDRL